MPLLDEAIKNATESRIRSLLLKMCWENAICAELAGQALLTSAPDTSDPTDGSVGGNKKRFRKTFEICEQCEKEYDVEENEKKSNLCVWHPGEFFLT